MAATSSSSASAAGSANSSRPASSTSFRSTTRRLPSPKTDLILGVAVVNFDHNLGPIVEWAHPSAFADPILHPDLTSSLPFCALPDGSHLRDEDFAHFHLNCPTISKQSTVFGISCNRQISSDKLLVRGKDVTRSTVQKAVVVLARQPVFAPLREKLGIVTRAFFAQGDLADTTILVDFHETLETGLRAAGLKGEDVAEDDDFTDEDTDADEDQTATEEEPRDIVAAQEAEEEVRTATQAEFDHDRTDKDSLREGVMYMGTSLRELIYHFRFKTLVLVKLLLLQKRIMFFGYPVEKLCVYEYTLVSLIPGLLLSLSDCSSPQLDYSRRREPKVAESVKTSDRRSLLRFCGCPLRLFGESSFFQPYLPLQQIDLLKADTWLVGTTNLIFKQQREFRPDVVVDLETSMLDFPSLPQSAFEKTAQTSTDPQDPSAPSLQSLVALSPADRKWMDELVNVVVECYNPADPARPTTMRYEGSEDWIRAKFEDYICSMLACVKYSNFLSKSSAGTANVPSALQTSGRMQSGTSTPSAGGGTGIEVTDADVLASYNANFINAFKRTRAYSLWDRATSPLLFDLVPYKHPCGGKVSALEDVSLRLTAGLHDLRLEEQMASGREALGNAGRGLFNMANSFSMEVAKRRRDWVAQQAAAQQQAQRDGSTGATPNLLDTASDPGGTATTTMPQGLELPASLTPHAQAAQQAAMAASTEIRGALGRFGNYLGSRGWGSGAGATSTGGTAAAATGSANSSPLSRTSVSNGPSTYPPSPQP